MDYISFIDVSGTRVWIRRDDIVRFSVCNGLTTIVIGSCSDQDSHILVNEDVTNQILGVQE